MSTGDTPSKWADSSSVWQFQWPAGSHLKLLPTRGAQEVLAVRVPEHVQTQLVGTAEGLVALRTLVDLFWVEAAHMLLHLAEKTRKVREKDRRQLANTRGSQLHCLGFSSAWPGSQSGVTDNWPQREQPGLGANRVWLITDLSESILFTVARKPYWPRPARTWEEEENACLVQALIAWATFVSLPLFFKKKKKIKSKSSFGFKWILAKIKHKKTENNSFSLFPTSNMDTNNLVPCSNRSVYTLP